MHEYHGLHQHAALKCLRGGYPENAISWMTMDEGINMSDPPDPASLVELPGGGIGYELGGDHERRTEMRSEKVDELQLSRLDVMEAVLWWVNQGNSATSHKGRAQFVQLPIESVDGENVIARVRLAAEPDADKAQTSNVSVVRGIMDEDTGVQKRTRSAMEHLARAIDELCSWHQIGDRRADSLSRKLVRLTDTVRMQGEAIRRGVPILARNPSAD